MDACQKGRFRRACWFVGRGVRYLQVGLWGIHPSRPVNTLSGRDPDKKNGGRTWERETISI